MHELETGQARMPAKPHWRRGYVDLAGAVREPVTTPTQGALL